MNRIIITVLSWYGKVMTTYYSRKYPDKIWWRLKYSEASMLMFIPDHHFIEFENIVDKTILSALEKEDTQQTKGDLHENQNH